MITYQGTLERNTWTRSQKYDQSDEKNITGANSDVLFNYRPSADKE